jgi:hypothetical protein
VNPITQYDSPFSHWPPSLLTDLSDAIYANRSGQKHLLYHVIQPQIIDYTIRLHGSMHVAMDLVSKRSVFSRKMMMK